MVGQDGDQEENIDESHLTADEEAQMRDLQRKVSRSEQSYSEVFALIRR